MPKKEDSKKKQEDVYTLHIDVAPHQSAHHVPKKEPAKKIMPVAAPEVVSQHSEKKSSTILRRIWNKFEFVFVSLAVFAVIYAALNWQALYQNAVHYYEVWTGYVSPLNELTEDAPEVAERLNVLTDGVRGTADSGIPELALEVYPPDMRIVIPRINKNVPVVGVKNESLINRQWEQLETDIQKALRSGVVHYPGTALPGENGNVVITGHSSYYAWDPGRFKDVFALLHDVREGDKILVYFNQKKYLYEVEQKKIVLPKDVDVLSPTNHEQLTLITCTPIGTNLKRLIVIGRLVEASS